MDLQNLIAFLTQQTLPPLVGLCFAWMGYRLIVRGFLQGEGDRRQDVAMPASEVRVSIYRSSPGILFTIFGAALIAIQYPVALGIFFQVLAIAAGAGFGLMGFQLFVKGVFGADSDLEAVWGNRKLLLKRAGPGTLFALFGAAIICLAVFYGPTVPRR